MATTKVRTGGVIAAGLALFAMFFGAGDLIWPLILGGRAGDHNFFAMLGLLISGVSLPLLGLISMTLFLGDTHAFFGRLGKIPGWVLLLVVQAVLGPFGSLPRLITLAHATLSPYVETNLALFSLASCAMIFLFTLKPHRMVELLGVCLAPILLLAMGAILVIGLMHHPAPAVTAMTNQQAFMTGLHGGYNTLDMIASFIFAPVVMNYFRSNDDTDIDSLQGRRSLFKKMFCSSLLAGALLGCMFFALTYLSSYYINVLPPHIEAERLGLIAVHLLGPIGALISCIAVALLCLTTAVPIAVISANYIQKDLSGDRLPRGVAVLIPLAISALLTNLGFMGIARMLEPILQIVCPGLIILCVFNILHKLYEMKTPREPIYAAFAISMIGYFLI